MDFKYGQVGQNLTIYIDGEKLTKRIVDKQERDNLKGKLEEVKNLTSLDKLSVAKERKLKSSLKLINSIFRSGDLKLEKEKEEAEIKVKAVEKKVKKATKKVKTVKTNTDSIVDTVKKHIESGDLTDAEREDLVKALSVKTKTVEAKATINPSRYGSNEKRRG